VSRRVLVTGATGFIGPHVLGALAARGDAVWALARTGGPADAAGRPFAGETSADARRASWLRGDLLDAASIERALRDARPDLVLHLAGARNGTRAELDAINVGGARRLVDAMARARAGGAGGPGGSGGSTGCARLVVVGSAAEYGAVPESALPIREDAPLAPVGDYGETKAEASAAALADGARLGVPVVVARVFNVTGPGEPETLLFGRVAHAIARAEREAAAARGSNPAREGAIVRDPAAAPAEIRVGSLGATRDLIDVRDVARALLVIADRAAPGAIINVGRGVEEPVRGHVARLVALARVPARAAEPPAVSPPAPARHVADVARLAALGFVPAVSLDESARDLLAGARAQTG